jgi:hypothetical protein
MILPISSFIILACSFLQSASLWKIPFTYPSLSAADFIAEETVIRSLPDSLNNHVCRMELLITLIDLWTETAFFIQKSS